MYLCPFPSTPVITKHWAGLSVLYSSFPLASCFTRVCVLVTQLCLTLAVRWTVAQLLCPGDSPGNDTGEGCHSLLQAIFPTQGSNPGLLHCRRILHHWATKGAGSVRIAKPLSQVITPFPSPLCPLCLCLFSTPALKIVHQHHFSRFHIYTLVYDICFFSFWLTIACMTDSRFSHKVHCSLIQSLLDFLA